jgi:hypothetical protein
MVMAAAIAAITISAQADTASEPHVLSNISIGEAVTEDVIPHPPTAVVPSTARAWRSRPVEEIRSDL